jgi:hypothetical protein
MASKITISFNEAEVAYLNSFLPEGERLTGETIKEHILRPFYDLPRGKAPGRPSGAKNKKKWHQQE